MHAPLSLQRVTRSQEELREDAYHPERQWAEAAAERRSDGGDAWPTTQGSSLGSGASSQEHLGPPSKAGTPASTLTKSGPGRWKTPAASPPVRTDPALLPPPGSYAGEADADADSPPPPAAATATATAAQVQAAAERKKREEQQRWYEKEKARLDEERERRRREQERRLGQLRTPAPPPAPARAPDTVIRELQPQQQPRTIERRDLQYITVSREELASGDSLSPDPWKRDAREKLEKQQQLHIVDLLSREIQELQGKAERSAEESDRLRKLLLEWQFQKRLQESKQKDEDDEEEEDDDVDTVLLMQRLEAERRARVTGRAGGRAGALREPCPRGPGRAAPETRGSCGARGTEPLLQPSRQRWWRPVT